METFDDEAFFVVVDFFGFETDAAGEPTAAIVVVLVVLLLLLEGGGFLAIEVVAEVDGCAALIGATFDETFLEPDDDEVFFLLFLLSVVGGVVEEEFLPIFYLFDKDL